MGINGELNEQCRTVENGWFSGQGTEWEFNKLYPKKKTDMLVKFETGLGHGWILWEDLRNEELNSLV